MIRSHETTYQVYRFVDAFIQQHGYGPSQREIAEGCYLARSGIIRHLDRLEAWGCIIRQPGCARSITLTGKTPPPLCQK
jgi:repressor LexA